MTFITSLCNSGQVGHSQLRVTDKNMQSSTLHLFQPGWIQCQRCAKQTRTLGFPTGHQSHTHYVHSLIKSGTEISFSIYRFKNYKATGATLTEKSCTRSLLQRRCVILVNLKVSRHTCGVNVKKKIAEPLGSTKIVLEFVSLLNVRALHIVEQKIASLVI